MNKPDIILLCDIGNGKGLGVTFRGEDVDKAVETASEPMPINPAEIGKVAEYYRNREQYDEHFLLVNVGFWRAVVCVQRGFDSLKARQIASTYLGMVVKEIAQ